MDFQKRPIAATTNKALWQQTPPTLDDLFESFINADCTHVLRQSTQNRFADDLDPIFSDDLIGQFSSLSSVDTFSNASTDPISIDEAAAVAEHCFWEPSFVKSPDGQTQAPNSSPIFEDDFSHQQASQKRGTLDSDGEFLDLKQQLQAYLAKSEAGSIGVSTQPPPTPLSVPARRVNTSRILQESVHEGSTNNRKAQGELPGGQNLKMIYAVPASQNTVWARRRGDPIASNGSAKQTPINNIDPNLFAGQRTAAVRLRGRQHTPYTFEHDYSSFVDGNPFSTDVIEPLSPFSTAYPGFSHLESPITSFSLVAEPGQGNLRTFFREVSYKPEPKHTQGTAPYLSLPNANGSPTPPSTRSAPQADWPSSASPTFGDELISPAVYGFDFGFDQRPSQPGQPAQQQQQQQQQQPWLLQQGHANHQSTAGANISLRPTNMIMDINPAMMLDRAHSIAMGMDHTNTSSVYPTLYDHPPASTIPTIPFSIAPRHLTIGNPIQAPPFSPSGMFSPSLPQMTLPTMPSTNHQQSTSTSTSIPSPSSHRHASQPALSPQRHHQRSHTIAITTPSHLLSPRKTRSPTKSPTPAISPGITKSSSPHRRSRSAHHRRKSSSQPPRGRAGASTGGGGGGGGGGMVGFVNFTADDSLRLLSGVAPSGSSKTKARREKEAAVERKKLGEAAKRVVLEAGGDWNCLKDVGLLGSPGL